MTTIKAPLVQVICTRSCVDVVAIRTRVSKQVSRTLLAKASINIFISICPSYHYRKSLRTCHCHNIKNSTCSAILHIKLTFREKSIERLHNQIQIGLHKGIIACCSEYYQVSEYCKRQMIYVGTLTNATNQ